MKLESVTKLDKRNKKSQKCLTGVMSAICDVTVILPIYGQFGAIRKPDSGHTIVLSKGNLLAKNF